MAEFKETINIFNRMHKYYEGDCMSCPMGGFNISQCMRLMAEAPESCEKEIQNWGKNHPPRMKWVDWLKKIGVLDERPIDDHRNSFAFNLQFDFNEYVPDNIVAASKELINLDH